MKCEMDYCIYNKNSICMLEEIEINSLGMCEACEIVALPEEKVEEYKRKRLKEIINIYDDTDWLILIF